MGIVSFFLDNMSNRLLKLFLTILLCIGTIYGCERVSQDNSFAQRISVGDASDEKSTEEDAENGNDAETSDEPDGREKTSEDTDLSSYLGKYDAVGLYLKDYYVQDQLRHQIILEY